MIQRIQTLYLLIIAALMAVTLFSGLAWFAGDAGEFGLYAFGLKTAEGELVQSTVYMGVLLALACALPLVTVFLFRRRLLQIRLCVVEMVLLLGSLVMEGVYYFLSWSVCCLPIWRPVRFSATNCWYAQPTEYADRPNTTGPGVCPSACSGSSVPVGELLFGRKRVAIRTDLIIKRMLQTLQVRKLILSLRHNIGIM